MIVGDIDPEELAKRIMKNNPQTRGYENTVLVTIKGFVHNNFDRPLAEEIGDEIDHAINKAIEEEVGHLLDALVAKKEVKVTVVDGEDAYYMSEGKE